MLSVRWLAALARPAAGSRPSYAGRWRAPGSARARQQLAGQALPEPEARCREPGLHQGAADHPRVRRGCGRSEQARALSGDPDRERPRKGTRWQADQPEHLPGASLRAAAARASAERTVAPGGGWAASLVQSQERRAARLPACDRARPAQRPGSDHGGDVSAGAAGEAAQAPRRRPRSRALVGPAAGADRAAAAGGVIDAREQGRAGSGRA